MRPQAIKKFGGGVKRVVPWHAVTMRRRLNALANERGSRRISAPSAIIAIAFGAFANQPRHKATASREATAAQGRSRSTFDCHFARDTRATTAVEAAVSAAMI